MLEVKGCKLMKSIKLAATAVLLGLGMARVCADQTNVVQRIDIQLFGATQGESFTNRNLAWTSVDWVRVDTRRVIQTLAAATANTFSRASRLVLVTPLDGGAPAIQIRDGDTTVDVTDFFVFEPLSDSVQSSVLNLRNGKALATDFSIRRVAFQDAEGFPALTLHFNVTGFATQNSGGNNGNGQTSSLSIDAAGSGDTAGGLMILQGNIGVFGRTLEVVPGGGSGGTQT
jgi:hypothetical protein